MYTKIDKELHMLNELIGMFYHYVNRMQYISHFDGLIKTQGENLDEQTRRQFKEEFMRLDDVCLSVCSELDPEDSLLSFFFKQPEGESNDTFCIAQQCCEWMAVFNKHSVAEHIEFLKSEWDYYSQNGYALVGKDGEPQLQAAPKSDSSDYLIKQINQLPYSKEYCMRLLMLFSDFNTHMDSLRALLERYEDKLKNLLLDNTEVFDATVQRWVDYFEQSDMVSFFNNVFRMKTEYNSEKCVNIGFVNMQPNRLSFDGDSEGVPQDSDYGLLIGTATHPNFIFSAFRKDQEKIMELLRLVCDKTKLEIMIRLSNRPYYCLELANEMGMNPGHMSRNLTALYYVGLLTLTKIKGKTFYTINNERVEQVADSIKDMFVCKPEKASSY